jgi:hypothetical protein
VGETKSNWTSLTVPKGTIFEILDESFSTKPNSVPAFQDSDTLIVGSDYGGESKEEPFWVYSFLLAGNKAWMPWEEQRTKLRNEIMPDARRMSYKKLGDRYRRELLLPILKAADDLRGLTKAFGWVSSQYLTFDLGHIRCGTTQCDDGSLQIEDFVAIPDLIAGALSEQFRASLSVGMRDDKYLWLSGADMNEKARPITFWFGTSQKHLKKHLFVIDPSSDEKSHKVSWFNFTH